MKTPKKNGLEIYKSKGEIRWRIYRQGRIIAASSEGYQRLRELKSNLSSVVVSIYKATIEDAVHNLKAKK